MADVNDHVVDNQWDSRLPTLSKFALAGVIIVVESVFVCAFGGVGGGGCAGASAPPKFLMGELIP